MCCEMLKSQYTLILSVPVMSHVFLGEMAVPPEAPLLLNVALILDKTEGSPINLSRLPTARESSCTTCLPCAIATS